MTVDNVFDYDTTTISPREAATWQDLSEHALATSLTNKALVTMIEPEDLPSLVIVLTAGLCALDDAKRIKE